MVYRKLYDGSDRIGVSIPCTLCRKAIEKYNLKWVAFDGEKWTSQGVSKPTHKQRVLFGN